MRDSLIQVWKTTGKKPKQLQEAPPLPPELEYIWEWFIELCSSVRLTYVEMQSWSNVTGIQLQDWEARLLKSLDRILWKVKSDE